MPFRINYYAPQIFESIGLKGNSAGLFATGVYGIVKIVVTAIGLMAFTEQLGRKVCGPFQSPSSFRHAYPHRLPQSIYCHMDTHSNADCSGHS